MAAAPEAMPMKMPMLTNSTWVAAAGKVAELAVLAEPVLKHVTAFNISMGVSLLLVVSGLAHAIPGPSLKVQAKMLGMPGWFIMCAGLLMIASGAAFGCAHYFGQLAYLRLTSVYAVSLCMGGAFITAAKIPAPMHRPGGMVFSLLTLAATIWSHSKCAIKVKPLNLVAKCVAHPRDFYIICAVAFVAGVLGRVFVPTLFGSEAAVGPKCMRFPEKEKKADDSTKVSVPVKKDSLKGEKMPEKTKDAEKSGARKRVDSPANRAKATGLF